jgi:CheY-like chemotaxis protein
MELDGLQELSVSILLAEDSIVNQEVMLATLRAFGCRVDVVENGREAVKGWQTGKYDLILMDCLMPEMDGYQATAEIRRLEGGRGHIPIIAVTARADNGEHLLAKDAGMDDMLPKPFKTRDLYSLLKKWMTKTNTQV